MSAVKEGCRKAFQKQPQRLVSPMYSCNIIVSADVLGKYKFVLFFFFCGNTNFFLSKLAP